MRDPCVSGSQLQLNGRLSVGWARAIRSHAGWEQLLAPTPSSLSALSPPTPRALQLHEFRLGAPLQWPVAAAHCCAASAAPAAAPTALAAPAVPAVLAALSATSASPLALAQPYRPQRPALSATPAAPNAPAALSAGTATPAAPLALAPLRWRQAWGVTAAAPSAGHSAPMRRVASRSRAARIGPRRTRRVSNRRAAASSHGQSDGSAWSEGGRGSGPCKLSSPSPYKLAPRLPPK